MISIIISSKSESDLQRCTSNIQETIGVPYELIITKNAEGKIPLTKVYNEGAQQAQYDTLCFLHEDIEFKKKQWGKKVIDLLSNKSIGAVGVAGSTYFPENGAWASPGVPFLKGRVIHPSNHLGMDQLDIFSEELGDIEVVTLDGMFFATRKEIVKEFPFDDTVFDGFHFYDADFCIRVAQKYKVIVTTDILLKHYSHGKHDEVWNRYKEKFIQKHMTLLPFTNQSLKPNWKAIKTWRVQYLLYKKDGKLVSK
jgi:hypothetical protein